MSDQPVGILIATLIITMFDDDTVFTARIIAEGGHIPYAADVITVQDVPDTIRGYVAQHLRWSAGYTISARAITYAD